MLKRIESIFLRFMHKTSFESRSFGTLEPQVEDSSKEIEPERRLFSPVSVNILG
jgi:hypothetical protein